MTLEVNVKHDLKRLTKRLDNIQKKQIPFAASQALNDTGFDARKALRAQAPKKLDRPTKFTVNAFRVRKSNKRNLRAVVYIDPLRWAYLKWAIEGGKRKVDGKGTGVPYKAKLNKFGNIPGRKKGLIKKKKQFIATIKGITGVWERYGKGGKDVRLMVAFEKDVQYERRFPFEKIVRGVAKNRFPKHLQRRLNRALATARR